MGYLSTAKWIARHPLCKNTFRCNLKYLHVKSYLFVFRHKKFKWIGNSLLLAHRAHSSVTINAFAGLYEFQEMGFLLHYLHRDDYFVDVGANAGVYTVLASKVIGCKSVSFEPSTLSYSALLNNLRVNEICDLVDHRKIAIGEESQAEVFITTKKNSCNHVVEGEVDEKNAEKVEIDTLDHLCVGNNIVLKIDVEGFESKVLKGAVGLFETGRIDVVIAESNAAVIQSDPEFDIEEFMSRWGFFRIAYDPISRKIARASRSNASGRNAIFLRDLKTASYRIKSAPKRSVHPLNQTI